jgi:hypothetical protein
MMMRERECRVDDSAPERPRVQVARGPPHVDLAVREAAQAVGDRRGLLVHHRGVGDDDHVALQEVLVRRDERLEVPRADLFLALEEELDVDGARARGLQVRLEGVDVDDELPLVVARAPRVETAVADRRLEGRGRPQLERVRGLHVVVPVDEDRRLPRSTEPLAVDDRVARGRVDLGLGAPRALQARLDPLRGALDVLGAGRVGRDRRDPKDVLQLVEVA